MKGSIASIDAASWHVAALEFGIELDDDGLRAVARIGRIELPSVDIVLNDTTVVCREILLAVGRADCADAMISAEFPVSGRQTVAGSFSYEQQSETVRFRLQELSLAGGKLSFSGYADRSGFEVQFESGELQLADLIQAASQFTPGAGELKAAGNTGVKGSIESGPGGAFKVSLAADLSEAAVSNDAGTIVTDALFGKLEMTMRQSPDGYHFDLDFAADRGEVYVEPVYANLGEHALAIHLHDASTADFLNFSLPDLLVEQDSLLRIGGALKIALAQNDHPVTVNGRVELTDSSVDALYGSGLQIVAAGTAFGDLETAGRISGSIELENNLPVAAKFTFNDVFIDDKQRRFAVYGLNGELYWPGRGKTADDVPATRLAWGSASAFGIILDGTEVTLQLGADDVELVSPLRIATMGGALRINRLAIHDYGSDEASGLLDAALEPIQLGQLTGAFGWPAFSGTLSGQLPLLQYDGHAMTVGGDLTASAFGGEITMSGLRLEQPFGRVPRLRGDLTLRDIELERLTDTFSFGLIQGRLSGDVTDLEMLAWRPVAMDLHLYTPEGDRSRH
ncbi:MAG: hypothetical protein KDI09_20745, partial [Halioglobus sp.]|nr:hypothetical protein [Halioglobus sp.]